MKLSILTAATLLLCPLIGITVATKDVHKAAAKNTKISSVIPSSSKCLIPEYQAEYSSFIDGHSLGTITRTAQKISGKKANDGYKITSQLNIGFIIFHDTITQTSTGKIINNSIVVPNSFSLSDSKKKTKIKPLDLNSSLSKLTDDKLSASKAKVVNDSLSYLLQLRMSIINGKMIHEFKTRTVKGSNDNTITLSSAHKLVDLDIKGTDGKVSKVKAIKILYNDSNGASGNIWLDPKRAYLMVKTEISMISPKNKQKAVFVVTLKSYNADQTKHHCLMQDVKKK